VVDAPVWSQWLSFAAIAVLSMVFFRGRLYQLLRRAGPAPDESLVGALARARAPIGPGERGPAELRGSLWTVCNDGDRALEAGGEARVERAEGVVLHVRPL
jgi:membrane protein implicated in regulation of membrane protease activity